METSSPKTHINTTRKKNKSQNKCKPGVHYVKETGRMMLIEINKSIRTQDILIGSSKKKKKALRYVGKKTGQGGLSL